MTGAYLCGIFLCVSGFRGRFRIRGFFRLLLRGLRCMLNNGKIVLLNNAEFICVKKSTAGTM